MITRVMRGFRLLIGICWGLYYVYPVDEKGKPLDWPRVGTYECGVKLRGDRDLGLALSGYDRIPRHLSNSSAVLDPVVCF